MAVELGDAVKWRLWPPSDVTRAALVERMATNLASVSFFSQKYGRIEASEAGKHAKKIEEAAFVAAQKEADNGVEGIGTGIVQFYAKHASHLMLQTLRSKKPSVVSDVVEEHVPKMKELEPEQKQNQEVAAISEGKKEDIVETKGVFDISGGTRAFLSKEKAEELFAPLLYAESIFTDICLSNWSFGIKAAEVAAHALEAKKENFVNVNLSDIVAGQPEADALQVMEIFSSALEGSNLQSLNLSDNALGEKGVRAFSALLKSQSSLKALYFMNNGISEEAAHAIRELLPSAENLRVLHFHNNMSGDSGAIELSHIVRQAPNLEDFQFSSTRVGTDGGIALAEALRSSKSLTRIDLRDNMFGPEPGLALARTLKLHTNLVEVSLSYLGLTDEGALAIIKALADGALQLHILELSGNDITAAIAPALAAYIRSLQQLKILNLSENELRDKGTVTVSKALLEEHENLEELDLSENKITRIGALAAAQAVANKVGFKSLNLNSNFISESGIEAVQEVLSNGSAGVGVLGFMDENEEEEDLEDEEQDIEEEEGSNGGDEAASTGLSDLEISK
jgi:Ran GTPase-activating protein 1